MCVGLAAKAMDGVNNGSSVFLYNTAEVLCY